MTDNAELSFEKMVDWLDGRLSPEEADAVAQLVQSAPDDLQADAAWLYAFQTIRQRLQFAAPPARVRSALAGRFVAYAEGRRPEAGQSGFFRRLFATLTFDSNQAAVAEGTRSPVGAGTARQLVYGTDELDIVLNLQPDLRQGDSDLLGQILPKQENAAPGQYAVQLVQDEESRAITMADEFGEFHFTALAPGRYQLYCSSPLGEVEIPAFEVA